MMSKLPHLHRTGAVVPVVRLAVAVIKAALAVEVLARHDGVDGLRIVAGRDARRVVDVVAEPFVEPVATQRRAVPVSTSIREGRG